MSQAFRAVQAAGAGLGGLFWGTVLVFGVVLGGLALLSPSPSALAYTVKPNEPVTPVSTTAVSVTTSATQLLSSPPAQLRGIFIHPTNGTIYIGGSTVTTTTGIPLTSGSTLYVENPQGTTWYAIGSGTVDVRVLPVTGK